MKSKMQKINKDLPGDIPPDRPSGDTPRISKDVEGGATQDTPVTNGMRANAAPNAAPSAVEQDADEDHEQEEPSKHIDEDTSVKNAVKT